jgi:hypothetical protein
MLTIKVNVCFNAEFIRKIQNDEQIIEQKHFSTKNVLIDQSTNIKKWFHDFITNKILAKLEDFQLNESGWALHKII